MLLPPGPAHTAAYLPGEQLEPDPPTGDAASTPAASPAEPVAGNGIRWELAPWRHSGLLALDLRSVRLDQGAHSRQAVLSGDIDFASYIWQPWFVQLRAGVGALQSNDRSTDSGGASSTTHGSALTGRLGVSVFPASRFPFELRADASDSRTRGDNLGADYRSKRLSLSQGWRPAVGNHRVQFNADHSRLTASDGVTDILNTLAATSAHQWGVHGADFGASLSDNRRSDSAQSSRLHALNARHSFQPSSDLRVETLASENETRLRSAAGGESGSDLRQISSLLSWRPREGQWLYQAGAPLQVAGSARWAEFGSHGADGGASAQSISATLGATQEWQRVWRFSGNGSFSRFDSGSSPSVSSATLGASVAWAPAGISLAGWQYVPTASLSGSQTETSGEDRRRSLGVQGAHSVSRSFALGEADGVTTSLSQSAAALRESRSPSLNTGLAHSASVFWQSYGSATSQSLAGLTLSDSITHGEQRGRFQMVNLQLSQRTQLSRASSWAANLTLQGTRNESSEVDPFTGERRTVSPGWQQYRSGSASYENQRAFNVPRLRFSLLGSVNSQQLERRAAGDVDAPTQRISRSLEARLDYSIGRLDTRLTARHADVDGRAVSLIHARVQRRF
jgi:hypothetical protein